MTDVCVAGDALAALSAAVDALAGDDLVPLGPVALRDRISGLQRQVVRAQAEVVRTVAMFDSKRGCHAVGAGSTVAAVSRATGLTGFEAATIVDLARNLDHIDGAVEALRAGAITPGSAAAMARHVREVGAELARQSAPLLMEAASVHSADEVRLLARHLRQTMDPGGAARDHERVHQRRRLDISGCADGSFRIEGYLDPEAGELTRTAIDLFARPAPGDQRSAAQRRHDALGELIRRATGGSPGERAPVLHGQPVAVTVVVPLAALSGDADADAVRLGRQTLLPEATWKRMLCGSRLRMAVVDEQGEVVGCGPQTADIPAATRHAVALRDGRCSFPTCDVPVERTEPHHLRERQHGGSNDLGNLTSLCGYDHRRVHDGGWTLSRLGDGSMLATGPFGERLHGPSRAQWSAEALARQRRRARAPADAA